MNDNSVITVTKAAGGRFLLRGPYGEVVSYEQASNAVSKVREWMNVLSLTSETVDNVIPFPTIS